MKINKQKRIGNVIIFAEGENPEFEIFINIFNKYLGYTITQLRRSDKTIVELEGNKYSKITLLNTPTNNINSIKNEIEFFDYIFNEYAVKLDLDTVNSPIYFVFDRDPKNNKQGIVEKLLEKLTNSQNDLEEQNGLLLLSYPSVEAFILSLNEAESYNQKYKLGKDLKELIENKNYNSEVNDSNIFHAVNEFINFLEQKNIINNSAELLDKQESIGLEIFKKQKQLYMKENLFYSVSQIIQILLDLQILEL